MIHHLSIAARDPKHSAEVLAEFMGGKAVPFPPNPGSFFAFQLDDHGSGSRSTRPGPSCSRRRGRRQLCQEAGARGFGPTHFALSVATDARKVKRSPSAPAGIA